MKTFKLNSGIQESYEKDGKQYVKCVILCDVKPITLPTTGVDVEGLSANDYIAPGSILMTKQFEIVQMGIEGWGTWL